MKKTIFLFGAGASFGCGGTNKTVPLGKDLFAALIEKYPSTWGSMSSKLTDLFKSDFKKGMEAIIGDPESEPERLADEKRNDPIRDIEIYLREMGLFFATFRITDPSINLYVQLFKYIFENKMLGKGKLVVSTLNYECLLDEGLEIALTAWQKQHRYANGGSGVLIHLHGSCNLVVQEGMFKGTGVVRGYGQVRIEPYVRIKPEELSGYYERGNLISPMMCAYTRGKPSHVNKHVLDEGQKSWQEKVLDADNIIIVGVKPTIDDTHIWLNLSNTKAKIFFCGDESEFLQWQSFSKRKDVFLCEHFVDVLGKIKRLHLLN